MSMKMVVERGRKNKDSNSTTSASSLVIHNSNGDTVRQERPDTEETKAMKKGKIWDERAISSSLILSNERMSTRDTAGIHQNSRTYFGALVFNLTNNNTTTTATPTSSLYRKPVSPKEENLT